MAKLSGTQNNSTDYGQEHEIQNGAVNFVSPCQTKLNRILQKIH